jgi:hypothetical protein
VGLSTTAVFGDMGRGGVGGRDYWSGSVESRNEITLCVPTEECDNIMTSVAATQDYSFERGYGDGRVTVYGRELSQLELASTWRR